MKIIVKLLESVKIRNREQPRSFTEEIDLYNYKFHLYKFFYVESDGRVGERWPKP